jgi:hypothetical protein
VEQQAVLTLCDLCREPVEDGGAFVWEAGFRVCGRCEEQNNRCAELLWKAEPWTRPRVKLTGRKEPVGGGSIVVKSKDRLTRRQRRLRR